MRSATSILAIIVLLFAAGLAYLLKRDTTPAAETTPIDAGKKPQPSLQFQPQPKRISSGQRSNPRPSGDTPPFTKENERIATFSNNADYRNFLDTLKKRGLILLGKSDRLRAIRFRFPSGYDLGQLDGTQLGFNYIVTIPPPPDASAQPGATGFGRNALAWLGVTSDNSQWGKGITVAVLDSGVSKHPAFSQGKLTQIELTEVADSQQLSHGTAVASIISGDHPLTPGVAPAADILSVRITDENGSSDSFTLAEGIIQAVDAGAKVINISMGSYGDSGVVRQAVEYAQQSNAVIVASSGNAGLDAIAYPAAYPGVISVGAVEAKGELLDFSNTGENLALTAPGFQVNAAWGTEQLTSFSGTSASAPFISGAIAATMSELEISATQATTLVTNNANEAGYPGTDAEFGNGILDLGRVMNHGTSGIYDAAIASQVLVPPSATSSLPQVLVTVENRGTETLINSPLTIDTPTGKQSINITSLAPGAIQTYPVSIIPPTGDTPVTVTSSIQTVEQDSSRANNTRSDAFYQQPAP